jgi:hypothetical protein
MDFTYWTLMHYFRAIIRSESGRRRNALTVGWDCEWLVPMYHPLKLQELQP